jgi:hypothetical protein
VPSRFPVPYWLYWAPVHLASALVSVETANKLFLSAYAAALPLATPMLATRLGRSPRLALFALPLVFNHSFSYGFLSCAAGLPLALFALVVLLDFLAAPSLGRWLGLVALGVATFFMHVLPWLALGVFATVIVVAHARAWRRAAAAAGALAIVALVGAGDWAYARAHHPAVAAGGFAWGRLPLHDVIATLPRTIITPTRGPATAIILGLLALSLLALLATARPDRRLPYALFAASLALFVAAPFKLTQPVYIWSVQPRFTFFCALFLVLCVPGEIVGHRRWLMLPALIATLAMPLVMLRAYRDFDRRAHGFTDVLAEVPRGASTLTLMLGRVDEPLLAPELEPFRGFSAYTTALNGGFLPYRWNLALPYRTRAGTELPVPYLWDPRRFSWWAHGRFWDYVISDGETADGSIFPDGDGTLLARSGEWRLYKPRPR